MHLLDTDIATLIYYGRNERVNARYAAFPTADRLTRSALTRAEMLCGRLDALVRAATGGEWLAAQARLQETEAWLSGFEVIPIDRRAAAQFDRLLKSRRTKFNRGRADLLIACIALAHNATLVTRNAKDFAHVPGLTVENWAAP